MLKAWYLVQNRFDIVLLNSLAIHLYLFLGQVSSALISVAKLEDIQRGTRPCKSQLTGHVIVFSTNQCLHVCLYVCIY